MTGLELFIIAAFLFGIVRSTHHAVVNTAAVIKGRDPVYVPQGYAVGKSGSWPARGNPAAGKPGGSLVRQPRSPLAARARERPG